LLQAFRDLLHQREGEKLESWLSQVKACQIDELKSLAFGIEKDKAAVVAELTLPHLLDQA
jgi:hypothetical protein